MDTLSHALWGLGLFGRRPYRALAFFIGAAPDLFSFGALFVVRLLAGQITLGKPELETIPAWTFFVYDLTHSWLVAAAVISVVWRRHRGLGLALLAWPFHILLDIPFHSADYFPTKMFWPLTGFYIDGVSWASPGIWLSNLAGLALLFAYLGKRRLSAARRSPTRGAARTQRD